MAQANLRNDRQKWYREFFAVIYRNGARNPLQCSAYECFAGYAGLGTDGETVGTFSADTTVDGSTLLVTFDIEEGGYVNVGSTIDGLTIKDATKLTSSGTDIPVSFGEKSFVQ